MILSNSKIKAFLTCEDAAYHEYAVGDYTRKASKALSRGSLLDAIVTGGYQTRADVTPDKYQLQSALRSTYGDGSEHMANLVMKSGGFDAGARTVIQAADRLLNDPVTSRLLDGAEFQKHVEGKFLGHMFKGEIDILTKDVGGTTYLLDLKKTASIEDKWGDTYNRFGEIRAAKLPWYDVYDYWMQLCLYKHLLGKPDIKTGIIYATEEEPSNIGLVLIETDIKSLEAIWGPVVKLVTEIESGKLKSGFKRCGLCDWCRSTSKVEIPDFEVEPNIRYAVTI